MSANRHRFFLPAMTAVLAFGAGIGAAQAQGYPTKPISLIVPFSAGGGVDATARLLTTKVGEILKQPVVIENVAGAAGTIGAQKVARAPADGYTMLFAVASPLNVAPLVAPSAVRYDTFKDFVPVAVVGTAPFVLIGKAALPANSAAELIQLARSQPGKLNFGTDGVGTSLHITAEMFKQRAGIDIVHVPYKSGPQVLTDVAGGQLDLAVLPLTLAQPFIKDGKVKAYGVSSLQRSPSAPAIPALAETPALKGFEMDSWLGVLAPAGTPAAVTAAWTAALEAAIHDPEIARKLGDVAVKPQLIAGPAFADYLAKERKAIAAVVQTANIKAE